MIRVKAGPARRRALGSFPLPDDRPVTDCGRLLPGQALFLHTDGAEDAPDHRGRFFPLSSALAEAVRAEAPEPKAVLRAVFAGLLDHTCGRLSDDVALLVLRNDRLARSAPSGARAAGQATADPHSTNHR
jgi:stage II sporulation SpoE-like protein